MNNLLQLPTPARTAHELEGLILGAVLDSEDAARLMDLGGLSDDHLQSPRVRLCWKLARRMVAAKCKVDAVTLFAAGQAANVLSDQDLGWLQHLQANNVLDGDRFAQVCEDLRKMAHARKIASDLDQLARSVQRDFRPGQLSGQLDGMQRDLASDYTPTQIGSLDVLAFADDMAKPVGERTSAMVIPTGIKVLDEIMIGFVPSLNVILGDPSIGKSALMGSILEAQLRSGRRVGFFGLEEGLRWLTRRIIAKHVGVSLADLGRKDLNSDQQLLWDSILPQLHDWFGRLFVSPQGSTPIDEMCRRATNMIIKHQVEEIFIDHIGEVRHNTRPGGQDNWAAADSYRRLRDLAVRHNVPVVVLAHRSTSARDRANGPPRPNEVGLTGEAEKIVRRMLGIWRKDGGLRATVIKNNEGKPNVTCEFDLIEEAAMVTSDGGRVVNLAEERRKENEAKDEEKKKKADSTYERTRERAKKAAEKDRLAKEKAAAEAKAKEDAEKAAKPQLALLDGGGPRPPEDPRDA